MSVSNPNRRYCAERKGRNFYDSTGNNVKNVNHMLNGNINALIE